MEKIDERWGRQFIVINMAVFGDSHLPNITFFLFGRIWVGFVLKLWWGFFLRFFGFYIYVFSFSPPSSPRGTWHGVVLQFYIYFAFGGLVSRVLGWFFGVMAILFSLSIPPFLTYYLYWL